jgi:LPXTG-site transpeptidase (sortase) family protein
VSSTRGERWVLAISGALAGLGVIALVVGAAVWPSAANEPLVVESAVAVAPSTITMQPDSDAGVPIRVRIPDIDVDADVIDLGLNPDRTLEVPQDFEQAGWYTGRSIPGEPGPSVIAGHVDSATGPAVFFRLRELDEGDLVLVDRTDNQTALYRVTSAVAAEKTSFPTERVYGPTAEPTLRLITCGGSFDHDAGSYEGNLIVFAEYLGTNPTSGSLHGTE